MKTSFTLLFATVLLCAVTIGTKAQNPTSWLLTGNSGTNPNINYVGTRDFRDFVFRTNSIPRMRITTKGYVGIGTNFNNPTAQLEVAGGDALINGLTIGRGKSGILLNTAIGYQALFSNSSVHGVAEVEGEPVEFNQPAGISNTAIGNQALFNNLSGSFNTATGYQALFNNTLDVNVFHLASGENNTANGAFALYGNTWGTENTATGSYALHNNNIGSFNTANGAGAAASNGNDYNTAIGYQAFHHSITGSNNTAVGTRALSVSFNGSYNTAVGVDALYGNAYGYNNTAVGAGATVSASELSNATALGFGATVNNSNKVRIGDADVTVVESAAGSWTVSDARFKSNITEEVKGLEFIKLLRPVVYNFDANKYETFLTKSLPDSVKAKRSKTINKSTSKLSAIRQTGFIAQEVEIAAKKSGYDFNGVHTPENPTDNYSLSYEKLVVPLVKAVQELSNKNDALVSENESLRGRLDKIEQMLKGTTKAFESVSGAHLDQNIPNPYHGKTIINYYIPANTGNGVMKITDAKGMLIKIFTLNEGKGQVELQSNQLAPGTYQYSLLINGKLADSKQMIQIK
jgi:hypothetical protein